MILYLVKIMRAKGGNISTIIQRVIKLVSLCLMMIILMMMTAPSHCHPTEPYNDDFDFEETNQFVLFLQAYNFSTKIPFWLYCNVVFIGTERIILFKVGIYNML